MRYLERDKEEILDCLNYIVDENIIHDSSGYFNNMLKKTIDFIENYTVTNPIKYYKEYYEQRRTLNKIKEILKEDKR